MNVPRRHHLTVLLAVAVLAVLAWPSAAPAQSLHPSLRLIGPAGGLTLPASEAGSTWTSAPGSRRPAETSSCAPWRGRTTTPRSASSRSTP